MSFLGRILSRKRPPVLIATTWDSAPLHEDWRFPDDPPHIVRRSYQDKPEQYTEAAREVPLVGVSFGHRQADIAAFIDGYNRWLELIREPVDDDPNAILVRGHWRSRDRDSNAADLGWIPREVAARLAEELPNVDLKATPIRMFRPHAGKSAGLRMMIWRPYKRRKRTEPHGS